MKVQIGRLFYYIGGDYKNKIDIFIRKFLFCSIVQICDRLSNNFLKIFINQIGFSSTVNPIAAAILYSVATVGTVNPLSMRDI